MDEQRLERALRQGPGFATRYVARPPVLDESLVAQRSAGLSRASMLIAVTALLVGLVAGAIAVGSGLVKLPVIVPVPSPSGSPMPTATPSLDPIGLVAYANGERLWVVNADGTGAHELLPNVPGSQYPIGWSSDGTRLLYMSGQPGGLIDLGLTDAAGSQPREYDSLCPDEAAADADGSPCVPSDVALSPDGTRVAYAIEDFEGSGESEVQTSAIVMLDLTTGDVTKLEATATTNPRRVCDTAASQGVNHAPAWSPDGRRLIFARDDIGPLVGNDCQHSTLVVNVDGSDLRRVAVPDELEGSVPQWSPDGSMFILDGGGIYTASPDFTGIEPLTRGGPSSGTWTRDGRIVLLRMSGPGNDKRGDLWIMDADGGNATRLEATIAALSAAGCMSCPYPVNDIDGEVVVDPLAVRQTPPYRSFWITQMLWQPVPAGQP